MSPKLERKGVGRWKRGEGVRGEGQVQINQYFYIPETFLHLAETRCPHLRLLYVYGGLDFPSKLKGFVSESVQNLAGKHWVYLHVDSVFGVSLILYYV